jgi:hypothetical protein
MTFLTFGWTPYGEITHGLGPLVIEEKGYISKGILSFPGLSNVL